MSLTVKEKEHWKDRIGRKINIAIEQLKLSDDASDELARIESEALQEAESSLGVTELLKRYRELVERRDSLKERLESVLSEIFRKLGSNYSTGGYHGTDLPRWVQAEIDQRAKLHRLTLLKDSEIGRKLLKLEREKEELLDTVWLSTSTKQIKQLWSDVAEMLKVEQTELQKQAIAMEPVEPEAK